MLTTQQIKESVIEPPSEFRPSPEVLAALEQLRGANEIEFLEKPDHPDEVKWLVGLLMLLICKDRLVVRGDPNQTWALTKPFLQEQVTLSGLGTSSRD
jgi:hypothetical protein